MHELFNIFCISQLLTHSWVYIISKGNVLLQIGLQKYFLSKENPSNSLLFSLFCELSGHCRKHLFLNSYLNNSYLLQLKTHSLLSSIR